MGSYCEAEGFYREEEEEDKIYCEECNVEAEKTRTKDGHNSYVPEGGGRAVMTWENYDIKCPKCSKQGKVTENYNEEDVSYYSIEERRAYRRW
jgi:Zn finger protein HypA/HybF involved in hydrogenase expression